MGSSLIDSAAFAGLLMRDLMDAAFLQTRGKRVLSHLRGAGFFAAGPAFVRWRTFAVHSIFLRVSVQERSMLEDMDACINFFKD